MSDQEIQKIPNNVPLSWLERLQNLSSDILMLASEPNEGTETQFMSKYFTFGQMEQQLSLDLRLGAILQAIDDLYQSKAALSGYLDHVVKMDVSDPYIVSSMTHVVSSDGQFGMISCDGYRLSAGVRTVFGKAGQQIKTLIPSLTSTTTVVQNPLDNYISAVIDENGHVAGFRYGKFSDAIRSNIGSATVNAPAGRLVVGVTTTGGKVTAVSSVTPADLGLGSKVYYKDYSTLSGEADPSQMRPTDLSVMKLTYAQLTALQQQGKITPDCIYMTVENQE